MATNSRYGSAGGNTGCTGIGHWKLVPTVISERAIHVRMTKRQKRKDVCRRIHRSRFPDEIRTKARCCRGQEEYIKDRTIWCGGQVSESESSASMRGVMWRISYPDVVFCVEMDDIKITFQNHDELCLNTIFWDIIMGTAISFFFLYLIKFFFFLWWNNNFTLWKQMIWF